MPIYEYKCQKCGDVFDVQQKFSDEPLTTHQGCGGAVERLISAPAIQFKGSGWYVTDYARGKGSNGSASGADSEKKSTSKTDSAKSDAKPAESSSTSSTPAKSDSK